MYFTDVCGHLCHKNVSNTCRWNHTAKWGAKLFVKPVTDAYVALMKINAILLIRDLPVISIMYSPAS